MGQKKAGGRHSFGLPNLTLSFLVSELEPAVKNAFVSKVQDLPQGWLKLKLSTGQGNRDLIIAPEAVFLSEYRLDARKQSSGFGAFLNSRLKNKKIQSIGQWNNERILVIEFGELSLVIELFGEGNAVLLDSEKKILMPKLKREWGVRAVKKGRKFAFPPERGLNPEKLDEKEFLEMLRESDSDIIRAVVKGVNIAPIVAEEMLNSQGLEKGTQAKLVQKKKATGLAEKIRGTYSEKKEKPEAGLFECSGKKFLLPFKPSLKGCRGIESFESVNSALNSLVVGNTLPKESPSDKKRLALERTLEEQASALKKSLASAEENRSKADAIYSNYAEVQAALQSLRGADGKKGVMYKSDSGRVKVKSADLKRAKAVLEIN